MKRTRLAIIGVALVAVLGYVGYVGAEDTSGIAQRASIAFPDVGKYEVLRGDFHMHTIHSDGKLTSTDRVKESYERGYDVIAITDHGNFKAYDEALPVAESYGLVLIRGLETGLADSGMNREHMVALGFSEDYEPRQSHKWETNPDSDKIFYQVEMKRLAQHGGFLILAHPNYPYRQEIKWGIKKGYIQGVEMGKPVFSEDMETNAKQGDCYKPEPMHEAGMDRQAYFANTDAHRSRPAVLPLTLVFTPERSPEGVLDAIRDARTAAWRNGNLIGHERLLSEFVRESMDIRMTTDGEGKCWVHFRNDTPIPLKVHLIGEELIVDVPGKTEVSVSRDSSNPHLDIEWENVWVTTRENLVTERNLADSGLGGFLKRLFH